MNMVFKLFFRKFVLVFFDDILVYSNSTEERVAHLRMVLNVLNQHKLYANAKKCSFGQRTLEYLGHIISSQGVAADPEKIKAMVGWPTPTSIKELRGFLGLTGYYRKFVQGYGRIAGPLTEQLKKDRFAWNEAAEVAFQQLKSAMVEVPVLVLPNFAQPFIVETDASGEGVGAVLMQNHQPIAYFSQALGARARAASVYERELMAMVLAIQKWRPYLLGRRFIVRTDQKSLRYLLDQRVVGHAFQKWMTKLMAYDFEIQYKPGSDNRVADALSRVSHEVELAALSIPHVLHWEAIKTEVDTDEFLQKVKTGLHSNPHAYSGFQLDNGQLTYKGRLVISKKSTSIPLLLKEYHCSPVGGHSGVLKTYQRLISDLFWVGMKQNVMDFVARCEICQRNKSLNLSPAGLLEPIPLPDRVWDEVTMDFIEGLPKSDGVDSILVVVDRITKYAHFIPLRHPFTAQGVAGAFLKEVVRLHGIPQSIISDRDKIFLSTFWKELFRLQGTVLKRSTAHHPQTDG